MGPLRVHNNGKLHSSSIGMNVCGLAYDNSAWSMVCAMAVDYILLFPKRVGYQN